MKRYTVLVLIFISVSIVFFFFLNLVLGSVHIPLRAVWNIICGSAEEPVVWQNIVWKSRVPQSITALVAGAGLSVSGLQMQTVFRNPLAGPSVLGISSDLADSARQHQPLLESSRQFACKVVRMPLQSESLEKIVLVRLASFKISFKKLTVVVLPFVPVTAITRRCLAGLP